MARDDNRTIGFFALRIAVAIGLVAAGIAIGASLSAQQLDEYATEAEQAREQTETLRKAFDRAQERNWTYYRERQLLGATATVAPAAAELPEGSWGNGIYLVGEDIPTGSYDGVVTGEVGYWARLKGTTGMVSSIEANGVVRGPFVITINPSDVAVELDGVVITARE